MTALGSTDDGGRQDQPAATYDSVEEEDGAHFMEHSVSPDE